MNMQPRKPSESQAVLTHIVRQENLNMHGSFFGGAMMALLDTCAAVAAMRHGRRNCVTARMSDVSFLAPVRLGHILTLTARVIFSGGTSMEVSVRAVREDHITGDTKEVCRANLTFVAIDSESQPVSVPPVEPETDDDKRLYDMAYERYNERKHRKLNTMGIPKHRE